MYRAFLEELQVTMKNVLIVYAHQHPDSFNGALLERAKSALKAQGHSVEVSHLYAQHFEPRATRNDIIGPLKDDSKLDYPVEASQAFEARRLAWDSTAEIEKLKKADLVIFQFPMYWLSVPAILKGWFDRVLISGVAFSLATGNVLDNGLMKDSDYLRGMDVAMEVEKFVKPTEEISLGKFVKGKKALLSFTTGGAETLFSPVGMLGDINVILWPIQYGVLQFCGFEVLAPEMNFRVGSISDEVRKQKLDSWGKRLSGIFWEKPLSLVSLSCFDMSKGFQLSDDALKSAEKKDFGLSVGQNMGKPLPKDSMVKAP